jgi:hypothetical protein
MRWLNLADAAEKILTARTAGTSVANIIAICVVLRDSHNSGWRCDLLYPNLPKVF